MTSSKIFSKTAFLLALLSLAACATQVTETPNAVVRSSVNLSSFDEVVLLKAELLGEYAGQAANIKAADKIDEVLLSKMSAQFASLDVKTPEEFEAMSFAGAGNNNVLVIKPIIKQIKFIGGATRFWVGAMAGSSVVIMDVEFIDAASGEMVANPGFMRKAGAYTDAFGVASNGMLSDVVLDVSNYVTANY